MEENVLETEVEATEEVEETFEEIEEVAEENEGDDEFEYDENGDIIVPDVEFEPEDEEEDTETEEETPEEETEEEKADGESEEVTVEEQKEAEKPTEEVSTEPDPKDAEIEKLRKRLKAIEDQGKDTLKKLGKNSEDIIDGLIELAAESEGVSKQEYKEKRDEEIQKENAREILKNQLFEIKAASDLKELHAAYPETQKYSHVRALPDGIRQKFGRYRDLGLSVKEAYAAANPDGIRTDTATAVKKQAQHASKEHLKSSVPKPSKSDGVSMTKAELLYYRDLFPGKSDAEIKKLYKQSL